MLTHSSHSALASLGAEFSFLQWVQQRAELHGHPLLGQGIGDDTAVFNSTDAKWLVTKDVIAESTHFDLATCSLEDVGRKALAVNLSDIAAMAGTPVAAFVGLVIPKHLQRSQLEQLYTGLFDMAQEWSVSIAGGDTNVWQGPLVISVTLMGTAHPAGAVTRAGAEVGDQLFVTGALGGSLESGRHLRFQPRIREAIELRDRFAVHAMLDLSDGLASDLRHLLSASHVGAELTAESIPIHPDVSTDLPAEQRCQHAICDGEDFELLFALNRDDAKRLEQQPLGSTPVTRIGEITASTDILIARQGTRYPLIETGFIHE